MERKSPPMEYLSERTRQLLNVVGEMSHTIKFELGPAMAKPSNGDMAWFLLTDAEPGILNMWVILCTPYGIFCEYNFDEERGFSAVIDIGDLLEHLQNMGYRKLTSEELEYFFNG